MKAYLKKYLPEIVYGGNDGIVTTFAIVSGFIGADADNTLLGSGVVVLLFGLANLFGDAASMGLGDFLSERSRHEQILKQEEALRKSIQAKSPEILSQTRESLQKRGLNKKELEMTLSMFQNKKDLWLDYMRSIELKLQDVRNEMPALNALTTFLAFIAFGIIPLVPFILLEPSFSTGVYSALGTLIALLLLGLLRWRVVGQHLIKNVVEILLVGGVASMIAFFVGYLFRGI